MFGMIFITFITEILYFITKPLSIMANTGKTVATLLIGAAVGAAVGYILATDRDKRQENMDRIRDRFADLKNKFSKTPQDLEEEIYHA